MKIEIATIQDVPEILELQYKAFCPVAESLNWLDAPNLTETVEYARGEFPKYSTLKRKQMLRKRRLVDFHGKEMN